MLFAAAKSTTDAHRLRVVSSRPFEDVIDRITAAVARPDPQAFSATLQFADCVEDLVDLVHAAAGPSGLIEFGRFDMGEVLRKERGRGTARVLRLLVGDLLAMKEIVKALPDAAAHVPVTLLVDERLGSVHLTYQPLSGLLEAYGNERAVAAAGVLDRNIERVMRIAAR